jgi:hypothetical protein
LHIFSNPVYFLQELLPLAGVVLPLLIFERLALLNFMVLQTKVSDVNGIQNYSSSMIFFERVARGYWIFGFAD